MFKKKIKFDTQIRNTQIHTYLRSLRRIDSFAFLMIKLQQR